MTDSVIKFNEQNFLNFDLNLMVTFLVLFRECSVSASAKYLQVRQPAVSGSLARLRLRFDDPLFVRLGKGMRPTPKALAIAEALLPPMSCIESIILGEV